MSHREDEGAKVLAIAIGYIQLYNWEKSLILSYTSFRGCPLPLQLNLLPSFNIKKGLDYITKDEG